MVKSAPLVSDLDSTTSLPTHIPEVPLYIGTSPAMRQIAHLIISVARTEHTTVLIHGESGTGKDLVAGAIHMLSRRATHPFVPINCANIAANLAESELFGSDRGAFTDARARRGMVETAHGGTLFLDEIAELSLPVQRTLLRFLETRKFRRLGSEHQTSADVRIIAATWRDLLAAVSNGTFRPDLYFRINVMVITLPSLRERRDDLPVLVSMILKERSQQTHVGFAPECSPAALDLLRVYDWPGNIRELRNVLERALILSRGTVVLPEHLPDHIHTPRAIIMPLALTPIAQITQLDLPTGGVMLPELVRLLEDRLIAQAMQRTQGNQSQAALLLGLTRDQLRQRLKRGR